MRLNSIKLAGFKSFAEPTNFQLPGQLVGVVGPNGCGKSNIMDAVRWVLGESKASELRGESMQDVIFNGTTSRKPASRASVELIFDNADHRAGGQWNQFTEIAVKRVLTRDGTSSYYINNQPVRRRDVQDVFLGTGLGPRAYAIIGQGTISRIIESRPEELRLFLEEAAGVSKYKERRRETENRLADTRENLTRVEDILRELNANLEKLEKQAEVAAKYNALQQDVTLKQHQLWYLKRADAEAEQARVRTEGLQAVNDLESRMADLRSVEADLEAIRQAHYEAGDQVNQAQGKLYEATAEVGKLEAEIRYVVEGRQRVEQRLVQLAAQIQDWSARKEEAEAELETLEGAGMDAEEQAELLAAQVEEQAAQIPELEDALRQSQQRSEEQRAAVVQIQQQIQVLAAEQRSLDEQSRQLDARFERLRADRSALAAPDEARLAQMRQQLDEAQEAAEMAEARLAELQDSVPQLDEERRARQQAVNQETARQADLSARLEALKALQDKVKVSAKLQPWLARHGLDGLQGLWSRIHIEPGWENALEAALRERLSALPVGRLDMVRGFLGAGGQDAPPARLAFYSAPAAPAPDASTRQPRLSDLLRVHDAGLRAVLVDWLQGCYTAPSLDEALAQRAQLQPGEAFYVASGHAVGAHSLSFYAQDSEQSGLLARAQEIEHLEKELRAQALIAEEARTALVRAEAAYADASQRLVAARREATEAQGRAHELQVETLRLTQLAEQTRARSEQIGADLAEVEAQLADLQERRAASEARFEELDMQLADSQERHAQLGDRVIEAERRLAECREQQRQLERRVQEAQFSHRSLQARRAELARTVDTAATQARTLHDERQRAQDELARLSDAAAQGGLQQALELKMEREKQLAAQRSQYDELTARLRASDERRMQHERQLDPLRARITEFQLKEQAARLGLEQYSQLLQDAQADLAAVARSIEEGGVRAAGLSGEIDRLHREIAALGAVNLAALDELTLARERKTFLDAQTEDLQLAMTTLEDAIRKIDGETRTLLSGTFETVNGHFGRMFPELFGGGQARLIMTGDEILDSGVQVMAQPPGKKNQTIHLLSGGEKALTAIALVFAIFQLNPAPFCLLDEVDAPLDDANTERYAKLVTSMSKGTQFLFISHNKIAMEMAEQLIGVTMQEQGVSRIVAVDMESALSMAEA
ncbi:chromosome segregation protein SMC [Alicycliphilus denitrificans]|uniref:Chromosome partition protein Smc n=2 Tax=Alicycliphilus denitrificans TaxID=179636 RepID=F4GD44_ALIDK|nr:chromosome segregation protein SMC [Alicycliphilus denitrificans]GAO22151.1 chromosome segregation protein SMC [Alicycliphilus sp. B1]ADU99985.1 chromosome segregation protein SMC [Alicycliphilus denitrificans BC]AEB84803.1 chromosome segregation protein SMC [Alicycliphilus denitrificans K601]QKD44225.1 chromosome segregation protein SMC [Alicycliphilus denitrificans]GAO23330.1 chromosome segregation protein SMC [Alicycliphilus sp. B1]